MKRIIMFVLLFAALKVAGQTTGYLRFDTVKIMRQNGTCELYIINKTKDSLGLLTNVGGGLTQFKRPRALNDSMIIIGNDTIPVKGIGGGGSTYTNAPGAGDTLLTASNTIKRIDRDNYGIVISTNANKLLFSIDTTQTNHLVTTSDLNDAIAAGGASTFAGLTDVTISSPKNGQVPVYDSVTSKWKNRDMFYVNVKWFGAVGDSVTDDRAAIIKARDYVYTHGGVLDFPAGKFRISDSILFLYPIRIRGVGKSGGLHNNQSGGVLEKDRLGPIQTSSEIIVTDGKNGFVFDRQSDETKATPAIEYITMSSTATPGSATGGAFIVVRGMLQGFSAFNCTFYGGYIQINIESGYYQHISACHFSAPKKAGLKTANNIRTDTGDFTVTGSVFSSGTFSTLADTTRAIWWTSGGGMRIVNNKFDACEFDTSHAFRYDIYATNILDPTSVFIIADNSIENYTISGIYLHGVVSPYVRIIQINNNEFTPVGSEGAAIDIDQMEDVCISEFVIRDWSGVQSRAAIKVTNSNRVTIGKGRIINFSSNFDLTGSTSTHADYMHGGDVAIGSLNTTNVAGLNASLYSTLTIQGKATSGTNGSGVLEITEQLPDADAKDLGYLNIVNASNASVKRSVIIGGVSQGSTANNRGGKLLIYTKADGGNIQEQFSIDNVGKLRFNSYGSGSITGTVTQLLGVTSNGTVVETTGAASQWTTTGSDIYYNTGNVGIGKTSSIGFKLDIETASTGLDGIRITNTSNATGARAGIRLANDASELAQFSTMSSTHATLPNFGLFEATKSLQFGVDQGIASGGSAVINFVTGGYSVPPSFIIKGTGVLNASSLAGSGTRMVTVNSSGDFGAQTITNGIYGGSGSLPGDVTVTGGNNSITFDDIFAFKINSDYNTIAKANGTGIYTEAIIGAPNQYWLGYTPVAGVYSKGVGIVIDTNENVGIGVSPPTTIPLYATGASLFVQGFQSNAGNFSRVDNLTASNTISLASYFITIDATSGNVTLTLPAASAAFGNNMGIKYRFQRLDNSGNTVTIQRAGSDTINGGTSFTITTQYTEIKEVQCTSSSTWAQY